MQGHEAVEKNVPLLIILIIVAISFGTLVELTPLIFSKQLAEPIDGLEPYSALELEGRDIYIREGCNTCHSQMVRPLRAETERYGHYSVAGEFVYDRPFLWGSKRTGPDLARVGQRYSDDWHRAHLYNPRDVVPESNMPAFPWLFDNELTGKTSASAWQRCERSACPTPTRTSPAPPRRSRARRRSTPWSPTCNSSAR
jgi:cytochrome c oxidase cbb3-type subunit 2